MDTVFGSMLASFGPVINPMVLMSIDDDEDWMEDPDNWDRPWDDDAEETPDDEWEEDDDWDDDEEAEDTDDEWEEDEAEDSEEVWTEDEDDL